MVVYLVDIDKHYRLVSFAHLSNPVILSIGLRRSYSSKLGFFMKNTEGGILTTFAIQKNEKYEINQ
jgi:hypothetical protein